MGNRVLILSCVAAALALAAGGVVLLPSRKVPERAQTVYTLTPCTLDMVLKASGTLQAVSNDDLYCPLEGQSVIRTIISEGQAVKKGEQLLSLDTSELAEKFRQIELEVKKADGESTWSREQRAVQESKNAADLEAVQVELKLAELSLLEYTQGVFPQKRNEARRTMEIAQTGLKREQEQLKQSRGLMARGYLEQAEIEAGELKVLEKKNALEKAQSELSVLETYTYAKEVAEKENKVSQSKNKLVRTQGENRSQLAMKLSDEQTKEQALITHTFRRDYLKKQLDNSTLVAPRDGVIIYGSTVTEREPLAVGGRVAEQQLLLRIPRTETMKVVAKLTESQVLRLEGIEARNLNARVILPGGKVIVAGRVAKLSLMPETLWYDANVKNYPVEIELLDPSSTLRPGLSSNVEIEIGHLNDVLAVPATAIYSVEQTSIVFSRDDHGIHPRIVTLGQRNDTHIQLTAGVTPGMQLLLLEPGQGRRLLDELGTPTTQPTAGDVIVRR